MDSNSYFGSFYNDRFAKGSSSNSDDGSFADDSFSSFLDKMPPNQNPSIDIQQTDGTALGNFVDSMILNFCQFKTADQISEIVSKKQDVSVNQIAERIQRLLYNRHELETANSSYMRYRYRKKDNSLSELERFVLILLYKNFQFSIENAILKYRFYFNGTHPFENLLKAVVDLSRFDSGSTSERFASEMAELEYNYLDYNFTQEDLANAGISSDVIRWWRDSLSTPLMEKANDQIVLNADPQLNAFELEKTAKYLNQYDLPQNILAKLVGFNFMIDMDKKSLVIGDRDPDVDVLLTNYSQFTFDEENEILFLLMLKNDLNFYIENLGNRTIFVNGYQVEKGQCTYVVDDSLIELGELMLIFNIYQALLDKLFKIIHAP